MIAVPRSVISIQSPWRQTPGVLLEVAGAVAAAVLVAPEEDGHRGHRLGHDQLADLADHRVALLVPGLDGGAEGAALELAPVDRQQRDAADEGGAEVGAAAGREEPGVGAEVLVDPVEALGRERAAGRAHRLEPAEVAPRPGLDPGLHAGGDVGGAGAEHRHPGPLGEVPEDAHVGVAGAAVVEDDRGPGQQPGDEEVPHHPAGRREPEEAVAGVGVDVEVELLQVLEQDAAVALDDRFRQPGGARGVEDPERVVEGDPLEGRARLPAPASSSSCQRIASRSPSSSGSGSR